MWIPACLVALLRVRPAYHTGTCTGRVNGHSRPSTYPIRSFTCPSTVWYDLARPRARLPRASADFLRAQLFVLLRASRDFAHVKTCKTGFTWRTFSLSSSSPSCYVAKHKPRACPPLRRRRNGFRTTCKTCSRTCPLRIRLFGSTYHVLCMQFPREQARKRTADASLESAP